MGGKKIFQSVAPVLLDEGKKLLTRKKGVTQAVKSAAKCSKSNAINAGKEALRQEMARYQKGGGLINTKARKTEIDIEILKIYSFCELWHILTS